MVSTSFFKVPLLICTLLATIVLAIDIDVNPSLVAKLRTANTNLDRLNFLPSDTGWFFDFTTQPKYTFSPGGVINANAATFPATVGNGLTLAMLNLGPCSMLPPHFHPRASNFVVAIAGITETLMVAENGARTVTQVLKPGQMTIFPQASVHTMMNVGCENAQLVSALSSDDAGTQNLANAFFSLPTEIVGTILGQNSSSINDTATVIPPIGTCSNAGSEACLATCLKMGKMVERTW